MSGKHPSRLLYSVFVSIKKWRSFCGWRRSKVRGSHQKTFIYRWDWCSFWTAQVSKHKIWDQTKFREWGAYTPRTCWATMSAISSKVCPAAVKAIVNVSSPKTKAKVKVTPRKLWEQSTELSMQSYIKHLRRVANNLDLLWATWEESWTKVRIDEPLQLNVFTWRWAKDHK